MCVPRVLPASSPPSLPSSIGRRSNLTLLFLEASEDALVRRFSETRRPHPLAADRGAIEGIRQEKEMLADVKGAADMVLDTSDWSIHEARDEVYRAFAAAPGEEPALAVSLVSFGFKHGIPSGADLLFDARFLANPHFVPELRPLTGRDAPVREYLEAIPDYEEFVNRSGRLSRLPATPLPERESSLPFGRGRLHRWSPSLGSGGRGALLPVATHRHASPPHPSGHHPLDRELWIRSQRLAAIRC